MKSEITALEQYAGAAQIGIFRDRFDVAVTHQNIGVVVVTEAHTIGFTGRGFEGIFGGVKQHQRVLRTAAVHTDTVGKKERFGRIK